jgi:HK97 family phage portal protein
MGFWGRIWASLSDPGGDMPTDPMDPRFWGAGNAVSVSGEHVTADSGLQLDVVAAVQARLAGTVSTLPMMVFKRTPDGGSVPAIDHPLYKILHSRPNRRQVSQEYMDEQNRHLSYWRNAYAEIVADPVTGNPVGSLEPIHPERVLKIERRRDGFVYYDVRRLDNSGVDTLRDDVISHVRLAPLTKDGLRGQYMWETSKETFGRAQAVEAYGARYFKNSGSGGVLEHPGNFKTLEDRDDFLKAWREGGVGANQHKDRLLLFDVKYSPSNVRNDEAQFLETLREMAIKLCRLWNMPPHMVGIMEKSPLSNIEQQSIDYVVHCLARYICAWEQGLARDLLIGADQDLYFIQINVAALLRGDLKTRWAAYAQGRQWGWLSIDDIRRMENMPIIGEELGGNEYLKPLNMIPTNQEVQPAIDAPAGDPDADPADDPDAPIPDEDDPAKKPVKRLPAPKPKPDLKVVPK